MDRLPEILRVYKIPLLLGAGSVITIALSIILLVKSVQTATPIEFSSDRIASTSGEIKIDIEGAVESPGLYTLPQGSRVEDAITAAGGFTVGVDKEACARSINRAMKLVDGAKVLIPSTDVSENVQGVSAQSDQNDGLISINTASETQLETLSGVGPVTAKKIIDNRPYQTLEEMVSKKAVGQALFEKIKDQVSL